MKSDKIQCLWRSRNGINLAIVFCALGAKRLACIFSFFFFLAGIAECDAGSDPNNSADRSVQSTSATTYGLNHLRLGAYQAGSDADVDNLLIKDTDRNVVVYANDFSSANLDDFRTWFEADTPSLSRNLQEGNADYVRVVNGRLRMESIGYNGGDGRDTYESWAGATLKQKLPENFELSFTFNRLGGWSGACGIDIFTDPRFTESALNAGFAGHWFGGFTSLFPTPINALTSPIYNYDFFRSATVVKIV